MNLFSLLLFFFIFFFDRSIARAIIIKGEENDNTALSIDTNTSDDSDEEEGTPPLSAFELTKQIIAEDGIIKGFYSGITLSAGQSSLEKGLYFLFFTLFKNAYLNYTNSKSLDVIPNIVLGYCAGKSHQILF
jgi:hypothetical protein